MNGLQRTARIAPVINVATIVFVGAIVGGSAVGLAAAAYASPCDPVTMSMTPQPVLSCPGPDVAPPAEGSPVPVPVNGLAGPPADGVPVVEPVTDVAGPPPPAALPPPGQPPSVPPVVNEDGTPRRLVRADSSGTSGTSSTTASRATCSTAPCLRRRIPQCRRHRVLPCYCRRRVPRRGKSHPANPYYPTNGFEGPVDRHATKPPCCASPRAAGTVIAKCSPEYDQSNTAGYQCGCCCVLIDR